MTPRIKICCIRDEAERALAVRAGADALGFVGPMPSGPGVLAMERITPLVEGVPPGVSAFLLTAEIEPGAIIAAARQSRCPVIQLVDAVEPEAIEAVRRALPGRRLVQVVHVRGPDDVQVARRAAPRVHAILLDSGDPDAAVKRLGGTGRTHDWALSRAIVEAVDRPVFLAGGLTPENIGHAIARVRPFGVDVCTGVRRGGRLDADRLARFVAAARRAS